MAKNKDNGDNVINLLKSGHFGDQDINTPDAGDPVMETMMVLTLDELVEYDRNPRHAPNAEYETLKASYLQTGASKTLLVVTKRPGEEHYFPAAGGNTRLRVLKELWEEFRDEKYYRVNCKFVPFGDDRKILVDHLAENDNRADYIFIDRARAIFELYDELDREQEGPLPVRAFITMLVDLGYPKLSIGQFDRFKKAVNLYRYIPLALDAGMHVRAIVRLQELRDDLNTFLDTATGGAPGVVNRFDDHWYLMLQEIDSEEGIDLEALAGRMFSALASAAAERFPELSNEEIVRRLSRLWPEWRVDRSLSVSLRHDSVSRRHDPSSVRAGPAHRYSEEERQAFARDRRLDYGDDPGSRKSDYGSGRTGPPSMPASAGGDSASIPDGPRPSSLEYPGSTTRRPSSDIDDHGGMHSLAANQQNRFAERYRSLADEALFHARTFAAGWGLGDLIHTFNLPGVPIGYGFWIDLPEGRLKGNEATAWTLLWDLASITRNTRAFYHMLEQEFLDPSSRVADSFREVAAGNASIKKSKIDALPESQRAVALITAFNHLVDTWVQRNPDPVAFFLDLPDEHHDSLMRLIGACRKIKSHADNPPPGGIPG